jgi:hypothetical protein
MGCRRVDDEGDQVMHDEDNPHATVVTACCVLASGDVLTSSAAVMHHGGHSGQGCIGREVPPVHVFVLYSTCFTLCPMYST